MAQLIVFLAFAVSLAVLLASAEKFVTATEEVGLALGVPAFVMGITVLAVGTSFPELITGIFAVWQGKSELVAGTVIGSNIANILLILGLTAVIAGNFTIFWDLFHGDLPLLFGSLLLLAFIVYPISGADLVQYQAVGADPSAPQSARTSVTFLESVALVLGYVLYLYYYGTRNRDSAVALEDAPARPRVRISHVLWIVVGIVGVTVGAHFTVVYAIRMASIMGMPEEVVAAGFVAVGTSLPELVVSLNAARRKNYEMAVGNVTGSNIFNTFVVLGLPGLLAPFVGDGQPVRVGGDSTLFLQMPFYGATLMLMLITVFDKNLTRTEGLVFLLAYAFFVGKLFSFI